MSIIRTLIDHSGESEVFRQTRYYESNNQLTIETNGQSYPILNYSRTGVAFDLKSDKIEEDLIIPNVSIKFRDHTIFTGEVAIKSVTSNNSKTIAGAMFVKNVFPTEKLMAVKAKFELQIELEREATELKNIDKEACKLIIDCSRFLQMFKEKCEKFEKDLEGRTFDSCKSAEAAFMEYMSPIATEYLVNFNTKFSELIDVDSISDGSAYHRIFGQLIYPFFSGSDLAKRAKEKPLGYAGDFEMMNQIYRNGFEGKTLVGKILHNYVANEKSSESVAFRKPYFLSYYESFLNKSEEQVNILSLASGPCVEFQEAIEQFDQSKLDRLCLTLFDLDQVSLEYAQTKIYEKSIEQQKRINVEFINASVKMFIESYGIENTEYYDLIYSGGLFDYLDNMTSTAIVTNLFKFIKPGGKVIIGNFTTKNSTKAFCHFVTSWHLIHKTEEEMRAWTKYIPADSYELEVEYDTNGINAFIVITKK